MCRREDRKDRTGERVLRETKRLRVLIVTTSFFLIDVSCERAISDFTSRSTKGIAGGSTSQNCGFLFSEMRYQFTFSDLATLILPFYPLFRENRPAPDIDKINCVLIP